MNKEPQHHWSFRVYRHEVDFPRIMREADELGITLLRIRDGNGSLLFVRAGSPDLDYVIGLKILLQARPAYDHMHMLVLEKGASDWYGVECDHSIIIDHIMKCRERAIRKVRVTVEGL